MDKSNILGIVCVIIGIFCFVKTVIDIKKGKTHNMFFLSGACENREASPIRFWISISCTILMGPNFTNINSKPN